MQLTNTEVMASLTFIEEKWEQICDNYRQCCSNMDLKKKKFFEFLLKEKTQLKFVLQMLIYQ